MRMNRRSLFDFEQKVKDLRSEHDRLARGSIYEILPLKLDLDRTFAAPTSLLRNKMTPILKDPEPSLENPRPSEPFNPFDYMADSEGKGRTIDRSYGERLLENSVIERLPLPPGRDPYLHIGLESLKKYLSPLAGDPFERNVKEASAHFDDNRQAYFAMALAEAYVAGIDIRPDLSVIATNVHVVPSSTDTPVVEGLHSGPESAGELG